MNALTSECYSVWKRKDAMLSKPQPYLRKCSTLKTEDEIDRHILEILPEVTWKPGLHSQKQLSTENGTEVTSTTEQASSGIPENSEDLAFSVDGAMLGLLDSAGVRKPTVPLGVKEHRGRGLLGEVPVTLASFTMHLSDLLRMCRLVCRAICSQGSIFFLFQRFLLGWILGITGSLMLNIWCPCRSRCRWRLYIMLASALCFSSRST